MTKRSGFGLKVLSNTSFAMVDLVISKTATTAVFVLLVRLLPSDDIAAIGITAGYLVFITFFDVGAVRALLRDYAGVADDRYRRDQLLTALLAFWVVQAAAMLLLFLGLDRFALSRLQIAGISFLFLGVTIDYIALSFQDWIKTVFYAAFEQALATKVGFGLSIARIMSYVALVFAPSLTTYAWLLIVMGVTSCVVWATLLWLKVHFVPIVDGNTVGVLWRSMTSYGIWDHGNRVVLDTLFLIDTVLLSWFGLVPDIAQYTMALKVNSLLFLLPMQLGRSLQLVLSHSEDARKRLDAINIFLKWNVVVSVFQLLFVTVAGSWLLHVLYGEAGDQTVLTYTIVITVGVAIMNLGWPLMGVINNLCNLRVTFITLYLPALFLGLTIYFVTAMGWGALGVAYGNILAYSILLFGLIAFVRRRCPFPIRVQWLSIHERDLLRGLLGGRGSE